MASSVLFDIVSDSPEKTEKAGFRLAEILKSGTAFRLPCVIALCGGLGAGKTVFVRGMASSLCPGAHVRSPTYTIVNEYEGDCPVFHFDMYRIDGHDDLYSVGFDDYLDRGICVIEWSEKIPFALPECYFKVSISMLEGKKRRICAESVGCS